MNKNTQMKCDAAKLGSQQMTRKKFNVDISIEFHHVHMHRVQSMCLSVLVTQHRARKKEAQTNMPFK